MERVWLRAGNDVREFRRSTCIKPFKQGVLRASLCRCVAEDSSALFGESSLDLGSSPSILCLGLSKFLSWQSAALIPSSDMLFVAAMLSCMMVGTPFHGGAEYV